MAADRDTCRSCMGTGIGNPNVEGSVCSACHGRGVIRPPKAPADEDRWAWNHFEPDPGEDDACGVLGTDHQTFSLSDADESQERNEEK